MKVILLENVRKVGSIGEIIDVKEDLLEIILYQRKKLYLLQKKISKK